MIRQGKNGPVAPRIKICGLTRAEDLAHCVARGVEFVGFNLYAGSKRFVSAKAARDLWTSLPDHAATQAVAVVVDPDGAALAGIIAAFPELAAVQFHGQETPAELLQLRPLLKGRAMWKAVGVATQSAVSDLPRPFAQGVCDLILLDNAKIPNGATVMGGSGKAFDWSWISAYDGGAPLGVAGGVRPDNAAALLSLPAVSLVDVSSGVETAPGQKSAAAIDALISALAR